jgi:hypothetical protein
MGKKTEEYSIYSDRFKREVDRAHREFFEKRGIDVRGMDGDLLFGTKSFRKFRANNPSWSLRENDLPISQFFPEMNYNPPPLYE